METTDAELHGLPNVSGQKAVVRMPKEQRKHVLTTLLKKVRLLPSKKLITMTA